MVTDNFDLRSFLVENKMTVTSRGNSARKHFLAESTSCNEAELEERKHRIPVAVSAIPVMEEAEDVDLDVNVDDDDFIDPEDLPIEEVGRGDIYRGQLAPKDGEELPRYGSPDKMRQRIFDRMGIDRESFNKFAVQALGKVHGNVEKMYKIICQAYNLTPKQARFLVEPGIANWKTAGLGNKYGRSINEDFADIANLAAREQDKYTDADEEEPGAAPDVFGSLGSTSYEAPEDFGDVDEKAIRRSYQSLKNQGIADERAMKILAKSYDVPEGTIRAIFRTELGNVGQKPVQVDEPKEKVSTFRMPKRGSAAEKAAMADIAGEFDDTEDADEFAKPGETDDEDDTVANGGEGAKGTINYHYTDKKGDEGDLTFTVPENVTMYETEPELVKRLQSYPMPQNANPFLRRALGTLNKDAAAKGTGTMYLYLTAKGYYATSPVKLRVNDPIQLVQGGKPIDTKVSIVVAEMNCADAEAKKTRGQAADAAKTDAQVGTATSGYGSMELSDEEVRNYVQSKAWNAKSIEQKLKDEYFPWSEEAKEYMDDDEIVDAKAELKNEAPVDPESDWAKAFASRK